MFQNYGATWMASLLGPARHAQHCFAHRQLAHVVRLAANMCHQTHSPELLATWGCQEGADIQNRPLHFGHCLLLLWWGRQSLEITNEQYMLEMCQHCSQTATADATCPQSHSRAAHTQLTDLTGPWVGWTVYIWIFGYNMSSWGHIAAEGRGAKRTWTPRPVGGVAAGANARTCWIFCTWSGDVGNMRRSCWLALESVVRTFAVSFVLAGAPNIAVTFNRLHCCRLCLLPWLLSREGWSCIVVVDITLYTCQ